VEPFLIVIRQENAIRFLYETIERRYVLFLGRLYVHYSTNHALCFLYTCT